MERPPNRMVYPPNVVSLMSSSTPPTAEILARQVAAAAAPWGPELAPELCRVVHSPDAYEASIRVTSSGSVRAGRMMIERAPRDLFTTISAALSVPLCARVDAWLAVAASEKLPLIVGWDVRSNERRCVKLYLNASDATPATSARLVDRLCPGPAAELIRRADRSVVLGLNLDDSGRCEPKLYLQSADARDFPQEAGSAAQHLAMTTQAEGAAAGAVMCFDIDESSLRPRAYFVALREPASGWTWSSIATLPSFDPALRQSFPFDPAPPRSVGLSLRDGSWTLYCKPRGSGSALHGLEPTAIFRADSSEVGLFVEPTAAALRAFRRTERHAISLRIRAGEPSPLAMESLVDWFAERLRLAESEEFRAGLRLHEPPAPWALVACREEKSTWAR
ncbi:MAG TPA: hypothetical protein VEB21_19600 [Terriglobales bacterium]|nr:hypothetical protein [Terriglobales bacterium]